MHKVKAKGILSASNGMNIYRGCLHGCIYCDSRSCCYNMMHPFEDIEIKENCIELLEDALKRKRKPCMISTGSMTDPYIPLERELRYTRGVLELINKYGFGVCLLTKSCDVLRDIDIIKEINSRTKAVVQMTLTTFDDNLCRIVEPNVSVTSERFKALCRLRDEGIPTVVWLCPILPFINDTEESVSGILSMCAEAKVKGIITFGMGLTLRSGSREYYYEQLDRYFPGLKEKYIKVYGESYELPSPNSSRLMRLFDTFCDKNGILHDAREVFGYLRAFEDKEETSQLSIF
ncbi:MAG: radical SAM protein [Clostridiaceae bacterium]|nr:radical SAM protein [Clostridiaceae bacterium]